MSATTMPETTMRIDDLMITIAYFSIPIQILVSLWHYPRLASMPNSILILAVLFSLFIFLCGTGHLMRCMGKTGMDFKILNISTAIVSMITAVYLLPCIPTLFYNLDRALQDLVTLQYETDSKRKLMTFMAFLCHEIRNPLFAITSSISFVGDGPLTAEQESALDCIHQSANLMLRLVNDVLDISKLESGKLQLESHAFDVRQLLTGTADCVRSQIFVKHASQVQFHFKLEDRVPQVVVGDSVRLLQIAFNLLSNASKFTEVGYVKYTVDMITWQEAIDGDYVADYNQEEAPSSGKGDFSVGLLQLSDAKSDEDSNDNNNTKAVLKLQVADTGPGIDPSRLSTIFEPFSQSKLSDYRKHGGTGLGLSILTRLAKIMGGTIHVTSEVGEGSVFTVYLPVLVPTNKEELVATLEPVHCNMDSLRIPELFSQDMNILSEYPSRRRSSSNRSTSLGSQGKSNSAHGSSNGDGTTRTTTTVNGDSSLTLLSPLSPMAVRSSPSVSSSAPSSTSTSSSKKVLLPDQRPDLPLFAVQHDTTKKLNGTTTKSSSSSSSGQPSTSSNSPTLLTQKKRNRAADEVPKFSFPPNHNLILIVDDNAINRKMLGRMLSYYNLQHMDAVNGKEAVECLLKSRNYTHNPGDPHIGLVFMDWSMPVMDGCQAIQVIRSKGINVPIVALTANALEGGRQEVMDAGANEFATKPLLRDDLYVKCRQYLIPYQDDEDMTTTTTELDRLMV